jgi:dTDP-4-dehydrorhamnose 3,5-epimerase-like enzyme
LSLLDRIQFIQRKLLADERGWFLKVIEGNEENLPPYMGEVYLTMALPGQTRGGHYHRKAQEWFTVVQGSAIALLWDMATGESQEFSLSASEPLTIYVPPGIAHFFQNLGRPAEPMILVAYSDRPYDPADTILLSKP